MYVTLHNPNFSVLFSYLFFILSFFFDLTFLCCLCWLIYQQTPAQPLFKGTPQFKGHLPWSQRCPLNRGSTVLILQYYITYRCMFTDQYCILVYTHLVILVIQAIWLVSFLGLWHIIFTALGSEYKAEETTVINWVFCQSFIVKPFWKYTNIQVLITLKARNDFMVFKQRDLLWRSLL